MVSSCCEDSAEGRGKEPPGNSLFGLLRDAGTFAEAVTRGDARGAGLPCFD